MLLDADQAAEEADDLKREFHDASDRIEELEREISLFDMTSLIAGGTSNMAIASPPSAGQVREGNIERRAPPFRLQLPAKPLSRPSSFFVFVIVSYPP